GQYISVAAVSATDIWAVGDFQPISGGGHTLVEHWNGSNWQVVRSPNVAEFNTLQSISVVSASDIWAVGNLNSGSQTLSEHWNGSSWQVIFSPNIGKNPNSLQGVAAVASTDVWAVGSHGN